MVANLNDPPFLSDDIERKCCADNPQDGNNVEESCLGSWKEELKTVTNALNIASAKQRKGQGIYTNAIAWTKKLKSLLDNAQDAHEKAILAYMELELFIKEVDILERNTAFTSNAIEALLCLIKRIFDEIFVLVYERTDADDSELIQKLIEYIRRLDNLDEHKKQEAWECINIYHTKVKAIYDLQTDVLYKVLEMLQSANILVYLTKNDKNLGLKWQLDDLRKRLIQETTSADKISACLNVSGGQNEISDLAPPCGEEIVKPASQLLPIKKWKDNEGSEYYKRLVELYDLANNSSDGIKNDMQIAQEELNKVAARKNYLDAAIKAAEAAEMSR